MNRFLSSAVCATAVLLSSVSIDAVMATASAQDVSVNFDTFHDQLASYGDWVYSDRWGEVWTPQNVPDDFHPYGTNGHWAYTDDYGWTWASGYEWGDIPFHYGRWVNDPDDGWLWIPGYVWSPGWVVWRSNGQYTGWMPMPPDDAFLTGGGNAGASFDVGGVGISVDFNNTGDYYGYSRWYGGRYDENAFAANWVFVGTGHLAENDYRRFEAPRGNYAGLVRNTRNTTNYTIVNNFVVNKSVDVHVVERAGGHPITPVSARTVFHRPEFIMRADTGRQVQMQMRQQMPRGTGLAGSAPKPPPKVVQSLSTNVAAHNGRQPMHLFTRDTVTKAPLTEHPGGAMPTSTTPAGGMNGPMGTDHRHLENTNGTPPNGAQPANIPPNVPGANPNESHLQGPSNGTTTPGTETRHEHHPGDLNQPNTTPTPPAGAETPTAPTGTTEQPKDRRHHDVNQPTTPATPSGGASAPSGTMATPPEHHDRVVTPQTNTPPSGNNAPASGNETPHKDRVPQGAAPTNPAAPNTPADNPKKDKKTKPDETPPPPQ
jgi:hypothetical protein